MTIHFFRGLISRYNTCLQAVLEATTIRVDADAVSLALTAHSAEQIIVGGALILAAEAVRAGGVETGAVPEQLA